MMGEGVRIAPDLRRGTRHRCPSWAVERAQCLSIVKVCRHHLRERCLRSPRRNVNDLCRAARLTSFKLDFHPVLKTPYTAEAGVVNEQLFTLSTLDESKPGLWVVVLDESSLAHRSPRVYRGYNSGRMECNPAGRGRQFHDSRTPAAKDVVFRRGAALIRPFFAILSGCQTPAPASSRSATVTAWSIRLSSAQAPSTRRLPVA
jgi:hypothetical protein